MKVLFTVTFDCWDDTGMTVSYEDEYKSDGITTEQAGKILSRTIEFIEEQIGAHRGKAE
jgi:hypothetical protein